MTHVGCKWMATHMDAYILGGCSEEERESAELHLATCADCRENVRMWAFLRGEVPRAQLPPLPPMLERRMLSGGVPDHFRKSFSRTFGVRRYIAVSAMALAAGLLLVLSLWLLFSRKQSHPISPLLPSIQTDPLSMFAAKSPAPLNASPFLTDASGRTYVDVAPGTTLWILDDAAVVVKALDNTQAVFRLIRGTVVAEIGPVPPEFRFVVETEEQEIEARGTVFTVEVDPSGASSVRVAEGIVEVRQPKRRQKGHIMTAGQILTPFAEAPSAAPAAVLAADMAFIRTPPSSKHPGYLSVRPSKRSANHKNGLLSPGQRRHKERQKTSNEQGPSQLLDLAQEFRRSGAFGPAVATYEKLLAAYPGSSGAAISLVSLGQLKLSALSNPDAALLLFERYLERMPRGSLRAAALSGKIRSLARLRRHAEVVAGVTAYLAAFPMSPATPEMYRRRGDAHLALGETVKASRDFKRVIRQWPDATEAIRAQNSLARCGDSP